MTQNTVPHRFSATSWACGLAALLALALAAGCGDGGEPVAPSPPPPPAPPRAASIEIVSGDGQRGDAGAALPEPVVVRVADAGGSPVAGATVAFTPGEGGGAANPAEAPSDAQGLARTVWTLGEADDQTLTAAVADGPSVRATASLLKPDDLVRALEVVSGDGQRADAGAALPDPVVVRAIDAEGAPVAGATVAFTPQSRGTADPAEVLSDAEGVARTAWTLGAAAGGQTLWAAVRGVSVRITATANNPDRAALEAFYEATGGAGWKNNANWLTDGPLGDWYGVTTDTNGRVVEMILGFNDLSGRIPPEIGRLTSLRNLVITYNPGLEGSLVPPELGQLANLTGLSLNGNGFSGGIPPELGKMSNLQLLGLTQNGLTGSIPPELGANIPV